MLRLTEADVHRILIVRTSALGDVVHILPALRALRELFPNAEVDWAMEPLSASLIDGHPQIDRLWVIPRQEWKRRGRTLFGWIGVTREILVFAYKLRRRRYDLVLDFQGNLRSAAIVALAGGRHRLGFHKDDVRESGASIVTNHRVAKAPTRMNKFFKNLLLVRELGYTGEFVDGDLPVPPDLRAWAKDTLAALPGSGPSVIVHPAVSRFGEIKRWPIENFRGLIDLLRTIDARVLITWGPGEKPLAELIGRPNVLPELANLKRFAALLAEADLVVAADTGALPMASTLKTPSVGLFGPKDAEVYAGRGVQVVASTAPCAPCRLRRCDHCICMSSISPKRAFEAALRALELRDEMSLNY